MAGRAKPAGEATDVIQAVGGEIAVVDEKDVHAADKRWSRIPLDLENAVVTTDFTDGHG
jgi:hypothetical protein